jgi:putative hydroxymethylpyrimidine transport system substrate-binding protein
MTRSKFGIRSALVAVLALAWGALLSSPALAGPCDKAPEASKITMMGDWVAWAAQGPMFAADMGGYYADEGLEFELISPTNPADTLKLVATGKVDLAMSYVTDLMMARDTGIPVTSIGALMRNLISGLMVRGDSGIKKPEDLKGLTIGVPAAPQFLAEANTLLASAGMTEADVVMVDPGYSGIQMFIAGKLDANYGGITADPYIVNPELAAQGEPPMDFLLYRDYGVPNYYFEIIVGNDDWLAAHPAAACRFMRATLKGLDDWIEDPEPAIAEMVATTDAYTLRQQQGIAYGTMADWKNESGKAFVQEFSTWDAAQDWALEHKLVSKKVDPASLFTNDYLP